jgi:hypothetical protein
MKTFTHKYRKYVLDVELDSSLGVTFEDADLLVEHGPQPSEKPTFSEDRRSVRIELHDPRPGLKYTLAIKPVSNTNETPATASLSVAQERLSMAVLKLCRATEPANGSPSARLTDFVDQQLARHGYAEENEPLGDSSSWAVYLWTSDSFRAGPQVNLARRRLYVAFGSLAPQGWLAYFEPGQAITGHAFRFGQCATLWKDCKEANSTLDSGPPDYHEHYFFRDEAGPFKWIVQLPLLVRPDGAAIGVAGFVGRTTTTRLEILLEAFAQHSSDQKQQWGPQDDRWEAFPQEGELRRLRLLLHAAFWSALAYLPGLEASRAVVLQACRDFGINAS